MTKVETRGSRILCGILRANGLLLVSSLLAPLSFAQVNPGVGLNTPQTVNLDMASTPATATAVVGVAMAEADAVELNSHPIVPAAPGGATANAPSQEAVSGGVVNLNPGAQSGLVNPGAVGSNEVGHWLAKLAKAVTELEYSGLVTFEHAGLLETLQVVHAVREGEQVERVRYLSGEPRELISHGSAGNCDFSASPRNRATSWSSAGQQQVQRAYQFILRGEERIADRDAVVIEARPRDRYRLGLVVSLDRETGLPLKTMLVSTQGRVLERYQFVRLDLSPVDDSALQAVSNNARRIDNRNECTASQSRWQVGWLPEGFRVVSVKPLSDGDMMVFSDGLGVFTVFVQRLGPELEGYKGRAIRGATVAYMDRLEVEGVAYTVTVVGEIPDTTARRVASSITVKG
ncbi:MucB/RseB C-terminal domain-containing protein [Microbulbifer sp. OS29]|uniref:MucB/RseB C-terminal domain-containing protein n=1 Tax=Microbulbifer okhotskensis TaxID=2926617 RepID=A0A9X2ENN4_9GAMM|nr:MucB/RseB C-terminal domain-containing protein [Microbulbifer okhotskensis]MCO1334930.1 MucB/RseB C-terminal domain-containing protein [Microbulbifer okhotskensis]